MERTPDVNPRSAGPTPATPTKRRKRWERLRALDRKCGRLKRQVEGAHRWQIEYKCPPTFGQVPYAKLKAQYDKADAQREKARHKQESQAPTPK